MPPVQPSQPQQKPKKKGKALWIVLGLVVAVVACAAFGGWHGDTSTTTHSNSTITSNSTNSTQQQQAPTAVPTPQAIHYPPTTEADLRGLAAKGDASAVRPFHSESVGLTGVCPQPKREITVDPSVTGQTLAEDLLAYFYAQNLNTPCGSLVLAYHDPTEVDDPNTGGTYTAGMINLDVTDSSGSANLDPNASRLKHQLTLDIGALGINQEYIVTY